MKCQQERQLFKYFLADSKSIRTSVGIYDKAVLSVSNATDFQQILL